MTRIATFIFTVGLSAAAATGIAVVLRSSGSSEGAAGRSAAVDGDRAPATAPHLPSRQADPAAATPAGSGSERPRTVHLAGLDNLTFSDLTIHARSGELIEIELHTIGAQPPDLLKHNFVLLEPGASVSSFIRVAAMARDNGYVPAGLKGQIIAATSLAAAGETVTTTFRTPQPGQYPFVCSYPGHFTAGMKGMLIVK